MGDWITLWWRAVCELPLIAHDWGRFGWRHFVALCVLYGLWRLLRPLLARLWLLCKYGGIAGGGNWCFGRVLRVVDGDTVDVRAGWRTLRVRLRYIDAPESGQPYGVQAARFVRRHALGRTVLLLHAKRQDRYGRALAEVFCPFLRGSLNVTMVGRGLAWAYQAPKAYALAEQSARRKKRGLWRQARPVRPAQWRRG